MIWLLDDNGVWRSGDRAIWRTRNGWRWSVTVGGRVTAHGVCALLKDAKKAAANG